VPFFGREHREKEFTAFCANPANADLTQIDNFQLNYSPAAAKRATLSLSSAICWRKKNCARSLLGNKFFISSLALLLFLPRRTTQRDLRC